MAVAPPKLALLSDLLEEHLEELAFLWGLRRSLLRSPKHQVRHLRQFEERIEAHTQGLLIAGDGLLAAVESALASADSTEAFAAAYSLLRNPDPPFDDAVMAAFPTAKASARKGIAEALAHAAPRRALEKVLPLMRSDGGALGVAAAEVLAFHQLGDGTQYGLSRFVENEDPDVCASGWRVAGLLAFAMDAKTYARGLRHEDANVRRECMHASAWAGQLGIVSYCRQLAAKPTPGDIEAIRLLAMLGTPEDLPLILACGRNPQLGPARFAILASYGHPGVVGLILDALSDKDPVIAVAAAEVFTAMTGEDIRSQETAEVPLDSTDPADDEFAAEFTAPVVLPDAGRAVAHWKRVAPALETALHIGAGVDLSRSPQVPADASLASRWEAALRSRFRGEWSGRPVQLELLRGPQERRAQAGQKVPSERTSRG
jgi:uncharacterized protein (TIGR02270 family)